MANLEAGSLARAHDPGFPFDIAALMSRQGLLGITIPEADGGQGDFVRRAMPKSLTNDEVYAVSAYVLRMNNIIGENDVMDANTLPQVKMPNRDGFIPLFPNKH